MTTHSATARWRALQAEADRLYAEKERAMSEGRYGDAFDLAPVWMKANRKALFARDEAEKADAH